MTRAMSRILYFDCFSGASGDMVLGALLDAGLPLEELRGALGSLASDGASISATKVLRAGVSATKFSVHEAGEERSHAPGHSHPHDHGHDYHHDAASATDARAAIECWHQRFLPWRAAAKSRRDFGGRRLLDMIGRHGAGQAGDDCARHGCTAEWMRRISGAASAGRHDNRCSPAWASIG